MQVNACEDVFFTIREKAFLDRVRLTTFKDNDMTSWLYLGAAVIFEIAVAISAGKAKGFTCKSWTAATLISGAIATFFLSLALLTFDVGVGYAIWTSRQELGS